MALDLTVAAAMQNIRTMSFDILFLAISASLIVIVVISLFYCYKNGKSVFMQILAGLGSTYLVAEIIKRIVLRPRPDLSDNFSFPSRHVAFAFFLAAFLPVERKWKALLYAWAFLVAFSRLWLNLHWLTDVVVGAGVGIIFAVCIKNKIVKEKLTKILQQVWR